MPLSSGAQDLPSAATAPSPPPADRLVGRTRDFLARLRSLLEIGAEDPGLAAADGAAPGDLVQAHLSFSAIPERVARASALLAGAAAGRAGACLDLARWMADLGTLHESVEALHAAGSISAEALRAYRALTAEYAWLIPGWARRAEASGYPQECAGPYGEQTALALPAGIGSGLRVHASRPIKSSDAKAIENRAHAQGGEGS